MLYLDRLVIVAAHYNIISPVRSCLITVITCSIVLSQDRQDKVRTVDSVLTFCIR